MLQKRSAPTTAAPFTLFLGLVPLASCGETPAPDRAASRDSAGVRIVETVPPGSEPGGLRLAAEPLYRVGWSAGESTFEDVVAGALAADGRAFVADGGRTQHVRVLSPDGVVEDTIGGPGDGPGEFRDIGSVVALSGDSLLVQDHRSRRLSVFHGAELMGETALGSESWLRLLGTDGAGRVLLGPPLSVVMGRRYEEPWLAVPLVRLDPSTAAGDTVGRVDWDQSLNFGGNNPFMSGGFATAAGDGFVVGRGDRPEIRWLDAHGRLHRVVRWPASPEPVPDSVVAAWEDRLRSGFADRLSTSDIDGRIAAMKEALGDRPLPLFGRRGQMPPYGGLMADPGGRVWVAGYDHTPGMAVSYHVLTPEGRWLGSVRLPPGFELLAVGGDRVLGVQRDEFDVQAVAVYQIRDGGPSTSHPTV